MIEDRLKAYDGFGAIRRGVNSAIAPVAVPGDQLTWMVNGVTRNGYPECRPGWKKQALKFLDENGDDDTALRNSFEDGCWQGAHPYTSSTGQQEIIASVSGRIFRVNTTTLEVTDLSAQTGLINSASRPRIWAVQAEEWLIIQDNESLPLIYNGVSLRRSIPESEGGNEIPVGSVMEYNKGRIWLALPDGQSFIAGDLAYSITQTTKDILSFTENVFLNGGGTFTIPSNAGEIRAMRSIAIQDTTTAQGPLQIFTTRGVVSVDAPYDREQWQNTVNPIQTISVLAAGSQSQDATVNVNGDIWFRSEDGIRSFSIARRDHGTWVNTPLSTEISRVLDRDNPEELYVGSSVLFANRLLTTAASSKYQTSSNVQKGIIHKGLSVLDFHPVSGMFNRSSPNWDGMWTGLDIFQILVQPEADRCFLFVLGDDDDIELYELTKTEKFDNGDNPISWAIETPSYGFDDNGWNLKQLRTASVWYDRITGNVSLTTKFRPDDEPVWQAHHTWQECQTYEGCELDACGVPAYYNESYRSRVLLPTFSSTCDTTTGTPFNEGYNFALRLEVNGFCRLKRLRLEAQHMPEQFEGDCPPAVCDSTDSVTGCPEDDFNYTTTT